MDEITWSARAIKDAETIFLYISLDSKHYATIWLKDVYERITLLLTHPQIGRVIPERSDPNLREIINGYYRIMYKISGRKVIVYRIIHSSKNFK